MPKSVTRGPARLLVLAVALGGPLAVVDTASATADKPPAPVTNLVADDSDPGQVILTWEDPVTGSDNDEAVEYAITYTDASGDQSDSVRTADPGDEREVFVNLAPGAHEFTVVALDGDTDGMGEPDPERSVPAKVSADVFDGGVQDLAAVQTSTSQVKVTWEAPVLPPGADQPLRYEVSLTATGGEPAPVESAQPLSHTFSNVSPGNYFVNVSAIYADGTSDDGGVLDRPEGDFVEVFDGPDNPTFESVRQSGDAPNKIRVDWYSPDDNHGFDIDSYDVDVFAPGSNTRVAGTSVQVEDQDIFQYGADVTVPALGAYDVRVRAKFGDGEFKDSERREVLVKQIPGKVQGLTIKQTAPGTVVVSWAAPAANGADITGYEVTYGTGGFGDGASVPASQTSYTFTGLGSGSYTFGVTATSGDLRGDFSTQVLDVSAGSAKGAPVVKVKGGALQSGEKATIAGTAAKGQVLELQQRVVTSAGARKTADGFTVLGKTKANKKGKYSFKRTFTRNVEVRVVNKTTGAVSPSSFVAVQKDLTLKAKKAGKRTLKLSGKVAPGGAGQVVKVLVKQGAGFVQVGQATTNRKGAYSFKHTFASKGKAVVRVVSDASSTNTAGSETRTVRVR